MVTQNGGKEVMCQSSVVVCFYLYQFRPGIRDIFFDWFLSHCSANHHVNLSHLKQSIELKYEKLTLLGRSSATQPRDIILSLKTISHASHQRGEKATNAVEKD